MSSSTFSSNNNPWSFAQPQYNQSLQLDHDFTFSLDSRPRFPDSNHLTSNSSFYPQQQQQQQPPSRPSQQYAPSSSSQTTSPDQLYAQGSSFANPYNIGNSMTPSAYSPQRQQLPPSDPNNNNGNAPFLNGSSSFPTFPQNTPAPAAPSHQSHYQQPQNSLHSSNKRSAPDTVSEDEDDTPHNQPKEDPSRLKARACARCKNLKVKCELKTETDPCKRCLNGGHECVTPGKKKRRTPPKREHLMNEIREQAEHIRQLMGQLEDANKKLRNPAAMSDASSHSSAPSPAAGPGSPLSPRSSSYQSLDGNDLDSETNKNINAWIAKAKESFAEFDGFISSGVGVPKGYYVAEPDEVDDADLLGESEGDFEFAVVSDGEEWHDVGSQRQSSARRSSGSSAGSNLTRGSRRKNHDTATKLATVPSQAVPFGLMADLSIKMKSQRAASAEPELPPQNNQTLGVADDNFFASPVSEPQKARQNEMQMPHILARGIITTFEAEELFEIYFDRMNLSLSLVDPVLYTAQKTCYRSPFMFTVICAIASRYYTKRPGLYDQIIHYAQMAAGSALITGVKNVEMVIGYILLSLYPVPSRNWEDQRGWMYLGLAIRTAMDINLHLPNTAKPLNELHEREMLNRTRVWLNCFNLDRSTGSQYGKLPIINSTDYTSTHSEEWWCKSPYNMEHFDIHISCYNAELRVMGRFISKIYSDPTHPTGLNKKANFAAIATETDDELKALKERWMAVLVRTDQTIPQNRFRTGLLKLAFSYARLVALSYGFQRTFGKTHAGQENPFLHRCLAAAFDVVDVTLNELGVPEFKKYLRCGPEAQTVFVTFASTFLIKLLQPKYAEYIDDVQRSEIRQRLQGVIALLGSPEVAVDERHGPYAYSRFLAGLLEVTLSEKPKTRRQHSSSVSPNLAAQATPVYTSPVDSVSSFPSSSPDMSMSYDYGFPSVNGTSLDTTSQMNGIMEQQFLSPGSEFFSTPLPFDDMLNSMQSITDPNAASWAIPGFDWMTNYRPSN